MRTFIFGAGASVHAGYPLAAELWRGMEAWTRATFMEGHDFRNAVDTMNAEFDLSKSFELVLTDLDDRIEPFLKQRPTTPEGIQEKVKLVYLRVAVETMIPLYFNSLRSQPAELYRVFSENVLAPRDTVITFNYDLALDREMKRAGKWNIGNGYGFNIDIASLGDSPCTLFKLHGSTNWRGEVFQGSEGFGQTSWEDLSLGQRPIIDPGEFEFLEYSNASDPQCHRGRVRIESIIMPSAKKKFYKETTFGREWQSFWDSLWLQAGEALNRSNEVYLIGYSVPDYDARARNLLETKVGTGATIKVCCRNGTAGVVESLKKLCHQGSVDVQPACVTTFAGWVSSMNPESTAER
jgi:hypothetical protein